MPKKSIIISTDGESGSRYKKYEKKTLHEHILDRPDSYIGKIKSEFTDMHVYDHEKNKIVKKMITFVPGLFKIFDEILVNARDQHVRDKTCQIIKINIDRANNKFVIWNDGKSIPVEMHKEYKIWVPELIFGNLLTSENYEGTGKIVGGKNGYGAKLTNIYSDNFEIEIVDAMAHKKYYQRFYNNMYNKDEPIITDMKKKDTSYTQVSFIPDLKRFELETITDEMYELFEKRVYDIAACTNCAVYLNDEIIKIKSFEEYINMFYPEEIKIKPIYEDYSDRWKIAVVYDPSIGFSQVSYVNGICTYKGGNHVQYITDQIITRLIDYVQEKNKGLKIKPTYVRENLTVFVNSIIEDPTFESQTKEYLSNSPSTFGSKCIISDKFIKQLIDTGITDLIIKTAEVKEQSILNRTDGKKITSLRGIPKLEDAKWAGKGKKSKYCRLFLTEGDSAKTFVMSAFKSKDEGENNDICRNKFGVFPLRGKLLNVRQATVSQLANNEEIKNLKLILGLKQNKKYEDVSALRYGGIIILTDQDVDGSHIKGLIMNFLQYFWPTLAKIESFVQTVSTPIVKIFKKTDKKKLKPMIFYSITEFDRWKEKHESDGGKYEIKYYKGLGTSTAKEAREALSDINSKIISYIWGDAIEEQEIEIETESTTTSQITKTDESKDKKSEDHIDDETDYMGKDYDAITLAFSKKREDDRKKWLMNYDKDICLDTTLRRISYHDFINKDLIHFSNYDNIRSIPGMDGLKPSQRKVMYGAFKKNIIKKEIKVAQFGSYVAEKTSYHHGEESLIGTIVGMAWDFVGSNNINLLLPNGNFGTRSEGGKNCSAARYIFTQLNPVTPKIFRKEDEPILIQQIDDGLKIEPESFYPIIPVILVNGTSGIGTGFSTDIPTYNPKDLIENLKAMLDGKDPFEMIPWSKGFKGTITKLTNDTYQARGIYELINKNTIRVTELPVGVWWEDYKNFLEGSLTDEVVKPKAKPKSGKKGKEKKIRQLKDKFIENYDSNCDNFNVDFTIQFPIGKLQQLQKSNTIEKKLRLIKNINLTNMHIHDKNNTMHKYKTAEELLKDFFGWRLHMYDVRKQFYIKILENKLNIVAYKMKFIKYKFSGKIVIDKRSNKDIIGDLIKLEFPKLSPDINAIDKSTDDENEIQEEDDGSDEDEPKKNIKQKYKSYDYITTMKIWQLTTEQLDKLKAIIKELEDELEHYKNTTIEDIWRNELDEFEQTYDKWLIETKNNEEGSSKKKTKKVKKNNDDDE